MSPKLLNRLVNPSRGPDGAELRAAVAGKTVLVTGASHGIGREVASRLARAGGTVLVVARSGDELERLAEELGPDGVLVHPFPADLSDPEAVAELVPQLLAVTGGVDVLVNNAGKSIRRSVAETQDRFHDVTRTIGINYLGPVRLLLELLPSMRERGSGHIVNVSTIGVLVQPAPRWSAYQASKAAYDIWLRSATAETFADGVTSTSVYLGLVHTRMSAPTNDFDGVPGLTPQQAAAVICRAIVDRPPSIAPWWGRLAGAFNALARGPSEALMRRYGRAHR
ncbi:MAG: hypothetical protein QOG62_2515 [Thermoleophilaceae bacterium]|nr:hypothetical protein [Thermoleophilaceae bacterium]